MKSAAEAPLAARQEVGQAAQRPEPAEEVERAVRVDRRAGEDDVVDDLGHPAAHAASHHDAELLVAERGDQELHAARHHVLDPGAVQRDAQRGGPRPERAVDPGDGIRGIDIERDEAGGGAVRDRGGDALDGHREPDLVRRPHGFVGRRSQPARGHRKPGGLENARRRRARTWTWRRRRGTDEVAPGERLALRRPLPDPVAQCRPRTGPGGRQRGRAGVLVEEPDAARREALGDAGRRRQPADAERLGGMVRGAPRASWPAPAPGGRSPDARRTHRSTFGASASSAAPRAAWRGCRGFVIIPA